MNPDEELDRVLRSDSLRDADRLAALLRYLWQNRDRPPKEVVIAAEFFGQSESYDPKTDSTVRTEIRRLRLKLAEYYSGAGANSPVRIEIPKGSYRPVARVLETVPAEDAGSRPNRIPADVAPAAAQPGRPQETMLRPPGTADGSSRRMVARLLVAGVGVCILAATLGWAPWLHSRGAVPDRPAIAVLPFRNLANDPSSQWLSLGLAEILSRQFAATGARVAPPGEVARMLQEIALSPRLSTGELQRVGRNLGASLVITGEFAIVRGTLRVDALAQSAATSSTAIAVSDSGSPTEFFPVALRIASRLRAGWGPKAPAPETTGAPKTIESMRLYSEGLDFLRRGDPIAARDRLERAAAVDPLNPLIFSALSRASEELGYENQARSAALRSVALSQGLTAAESLEVEGQYRRAIDDREGAVQVFRKLFALFPDVLDQGLMLAYVEEEAGHELEALRTLEALHGLSEPDGSDPRIDLRESLATALTGNMDRARLIARRAAGRAQARGARLIYAHARLLESGIMQNLGCSDRDIQPVRDEARRICEEAGDRNCVAAAWRQEGNLMMGGRQLQEAAQCYRRALEIVRQTGNRKEMLHLLSGLGAISMERGDFRGAESSFLEGLRIAKGNKRGYLELRVPCPRRSKPRGGSSRQRRSWRRRLSKRVPPTIAKRWGSRGFPSEK